MRGFSPSDTSPFHSICSQTDPSHPRKIREVQRILCSTVDQVEPFMHSLQSGDGRDQDIVTEVIRSFRRFKGLPESEDDVAVQAALSGQSAAADEMVLPPVAETGNARDGEMGAPATES